MQKVIMDTRETTYQWLFALDNLENCMGTINSNIELFNMHVNISREDLLARGETVNDLIMKLFKSYKATSDTKFVEYMDKKEKVYLDDKDFEPDELMQVSLNKYILRKENGERGATSAEQEQLTALTAELNKFKSDSKKKPYNKPKDRIKDLRNKPYLH